MDKSVVRPNHQRSNGVCQAKEAETEVVPAGTWTMPVSTAAAKDGQQLRLMASPVRPGTGVLRVQSYGTPKGFRRCSSDTGDRAETGWKPGASCAPWPQRRSPTRVLRVQKARKPVRIRTCQSGRRAAPAGLCRAGGRTVTTSGFLPLVARNRQRQAGPPGLTALHVEFRQDGAEVRGRGPDGGRGQSENFGDLGHFCGLFRAHASGNSVRSTRLPALPFLPAHRFTARPGTAIGERAAPSSTNEARAWPARRLRPGLNC
jgi:hypothetical protein